MDVFSWKTAHDTRRSGSAEWQDIENGGRKPINHRRPRACPLPLMNIDKKDRLILEALQTDARQSLAAIGKRIGLSQPAMSERVRKLEEAGVIEGSGARSKQNNPMARTGRMSELQNLASFLMAPGQCDWLTGQSIMMDGGNALATGGNFYELRQWSDADWLAARERIEAQNQKDKAQR